MISCAPALVAKSTKAWAAAERSADGQHETDPELSGDARHERPHVVGVRYVELRLQALGERDRREMDTDRGQRWRDETETIHNGLDALTGREPAVRRSLDVLRI